MAGRRYQKTQNSHLSPFRLKFGQRIGAGQDNYVREFGAPISGPEFDKSKRIVKLANQPSSEIPTKDEIERRALYKKKKYEILKLFLGNYVPDSSFVVGHKTEGQR